MSHTTATSKEVEFFLDTVFSAWKNDQQEDEEKMKNKTLMEHLPKNVMYEIKPFALMQLAKAKQAITDAKPASLIEFFSELAEICARNFWEKELAEVNNGLDDPTFCMAVFNQVVVEQGLIPTFSRLIFQAANDVFDLHPDPEVEQIYL